MRAAAQRFLHTDGGFTLPAPVKMHPSELPLTLSADVLRLPYLPATRLVLAEIVSLFAATGCCDASDPHFAARLTINKDTVSVAVGKLEADGLITKVVVPVQGGKYRTLTPNPGAIAAKAATNAYPEVPVNTRRNFRRVEEKADSQTGISGLHTPEIPVAHAGNSGLHTPEKPVSHAGISGGNIPYNNTGNITSPNNDAAGAAALGSEKKIEPSLPALAVASHTEGGAADVATSITKRRLLMRDSPLAEFTAFVSFWQAAAEKNPATYAPYAEADLLYYHDALLGWSNAEGKTKFDWLSTILGSMRRDAEKGGVRRLGAKPGAPSQVATRQTVIEETLAARRARRAQMS
jgi:DNA-binding MarR family transcriptional regulator